PKKPKEKVDAEAVLKRLIKVEKKVNAMSKIDHTKTIDKSQQAHLKKVLPKSIPDFVIQNTPSPSETYDALMDSLLVDEDDIDKRYKVQSNLKKRHHYDKDPPADDKRIRKRDERILMHLHPRKTKIKLNDVVNAEKPTQYDVVPKQGNSNWFKQDVVERPEIPDQIG
ncbi:hypothetical protein Tco_1100966, partial [Tanacetum coccineum]